MAMTTLTGGLLAVTLAITPGDSVEPGHPWGILLNRLEEFLSLAIIPLCILPALLLTHETLAARRVSRDRAYAGLIYLYAWGLPIYGLMSLGGVILVGQETAQRVAWYCLAIISYSKLRTLQRHGFGLRETEIISGLALVIATCAGVGAVWGLFLQFWLGLVGNVPAPPPFLIP